MSLQRYTEYQTLIEKIIEVIKGEMTLYTRSLILYGSYQKVYKNQSDNFVSGFIPGESDLDLVLILAIDDPNPAKPVNRLAKISESLGCLLFDPEYASILDLVVLEYTDLPPSASASFSPIHLTSAARNGITLYGKENVLRDFYYSDRRLKKTAEAYIESLYENLRNAFFRQCYLPLDDLEYLAMDTVLEISHSVLAFEGAFDVLRFEVAEEFSKRFEGILSDKTLETVQKSIQFRLGKGKGKMDLNYIKEALIFTRQMMLHVREKTHDL